MSIRQTSGSAPIKDSSGDVINPSSEESNLLLRRILKVLESNNVTDSKQRQRVVIDAVGANNFSNSVEVNSYLPIIAGLQTWGNIPVQNTNTVSVTEAPVDQRWRVAEDSHISYQASIRSHLAFT